MLCRPFWELINNFRSPLGRVPCCGTKGVGVWCFKSNFMSVLPNHMIRRQLGGTWKQSIRRWILNDVIGPNDVWDSENEIGSVAANVCNLIVALQIGGFDGEFELYRYRSRWKRLSIFCKIIHLIIPHKRIKLIKTFWRSIIFHVFMCYKRNLYFYRP